MSKESLDDESLFGTLKMDPNLSREGNMVWGDDHDDNDEDDNVVFSLDPPDDVSRGSGGKMTIFSNGSFDQCKYPDPLIYTPI